MTYRLPKSADVGKLEHAISLHQVILPLIKRSKKSDKNEILELLEEIGGELLEDLTVEEKTIIKKFKEKSK